MSLHGKAMLQAVTTGGSAEVYCEAGRHGHTVRDFLLPYEQSARLCGMRYLAPFVVHGVGHLDDAALAARSRDYARVLSALREGTLDLETAGAARCLNVPAQISDFQTRMRSVGECRLAKSETCPQSKFPMNDPGFFQSALVYLLAAVVSVPIAKRLGLGSVLGYLVAGCVIGPHALGWVGGGERHEGVMHVAESGVVVMLFLIGLELRLPALWKMKGALLGLGGSQVLFTGIALGLGAMLAGFDVRQAFVAGFHSVAKFHGDRPPESAGERAPHHRGGRHAFATLLFQDLAVIPMLAVLPLLAAKVPEGTAAATGPMADLPSWVRGLAVPAAIAGVVLAGRWLSPPPATLPDPGFARFSPPPPCFSSWPSAR